MMSRAAIALTGKSATGKSHLAAYLSSTFEYQTYSVSDEIRVEATKAGLTSFGRSELLTFADGFRAIHGGTVFSRIVLDRIVADASTLAIIDGVRSIQSLDLIRRRLASDRYEVVVVGLTCEDAIRNQRRGGRDVAPEEDAVHAMYISPFETLLKASDLTFDNSGTQEDLRRFGFQLHSIVTDRIK